MFSNLNKEILSNGMSWRSTAAAIGMPESTFRNKITVGDFTVTEALTIKERVLPKYDLAYLFAKDSEEKE
ncbi:MAG: hypothetical protein IJU51_02095 [Clostridia bacterium]|nr:hypothetical protein [Clostridia bacterium]